MSDAERRSREDFYGNLVWIIDGRGFRKNFDILHLLPDPTSELAKDLVWLKSKRHMEGANEGIFLRLSENAIDYPQGLTKATLKGGWVHGLREIEAELHQAYRGHHQYDWVRPRRTWLDATCPVYIDFGEDFLIRLEVYDESGLPCIRYIAKRKFVYDVMHETHARDIATRFFPIPE